MKPLKAVLTGAAVAIAFGGGYFVRSREMRNVQAEYRACVVEESNLVENHPDYRDCVAWGASVTSFRMVTGKATPFTSAPCLRRKDGLTEAGLAAAAEFDKSSEGDDSEATPKQIIARISALK